MRAKQEILKELKEIDVESCTIDRAYILLFEIVNEITAFDLVKNFVDYERLEDLARNELDEYGVGFVANFLDDINDFSHNIYYIYGEDKARNVGINDLKCLKYELERRVAGGKKNEIKE